MKHFRVPSSPAAVDRLSVNVSCCGSNNLVLLDLLVHGQPPTRPLSRMHGKMQESTIGLRDRSGFPTLRPSFHDILTTTTCIYT